MPVEFIGMISTRDQSETRRSRGPVVDRDYVRRFARAHEDAGFDRVLIGYSSSQPDGTQVAAYAAAHTDRLSFLVAHRPGFVAPTLAARTFATLDQFAGGRIAVHIITGGSDAEQRRDGDHLAKDERYDRTDEYLDIVKQAWTSDAPFSYQGRYYQLEDFYAEVRSAQQPRIPLYFGGSSDAAYRVGGKHADVYALWGEPLAETARADRLGAGRRRGGRPDPAPGSAFRSGPSSARPRSWPGSGRTRSWPPPRRTSRTFRASGAGRPGAWAAPQPQNRGSQRLLAAAAKGELHDRALWTPLAAATGAAGQLHRAGRHAGDGGPGAARLRGHRRDHAAHPGLRPLRRRHRLRPAPAAAGPRGGQPAATGSRRPGGRGGLGGAGRTSMSRRQIKLGRRHHGRGRARRTTTSGSTRRSPATPA